MKVELTEKGCNVLLSLLEIAPTLLELAQDVAKNGVKTALHGILDANLKTQAKPAFTETNHTDFILNSPGEYKSPRRCISNEEIYEYLNKLDASLAGAFESIRSEITNLATQSGYIHNGNRVHLQELIKQIEELKAGVNFTFSDAMADHLGGLTRNSTLTLNSLEDIKKTLANGEYSRKSYGQGNTFNPMYPYTPGNAPAVIWNTEPLPTQQTLPINNILMEDVFKLADKLDAEEKSNG